MLRCEETGEEIARKRVRPLRRKLNDRDCEENGLSYMGGDIQARRKHAKAPICEVAMSWWRKEGDDFRAALRERQRSKVGRLARLRGQVETID